MPCNSDYMSASSKEKEASRMLCLLEEMRTGVPVNPHSHEWGGYHGGAYNRNLTDSDMNTLAKELCALCRSDGVEGRSLELQIWWRDHQKMDAQREEAEQRDAARTRLKEQVLAKLTPEEREVFGL